MEAECCPRFNPRQWDGSILKWENKRFVKAKVFTLFYVPVNFAGVMQMLDKKVREAGATMPYGLCLSDHTSMWNMDVYLAVDKKVPDLENIRMNGKYLSKVYEGPFKNTGKWCGNFKKFAEKKKVKVGKMYMWYTTCPKCAKKYGKNYVVILAKINNG